ncbi:MAG TPA: helix-turn-helix domain-containing protein [Solirubrobacterales bacterium]
MFAVSEPGAESNPEYAHGLRASVSAALEHGLSALGRSEQRAPAIPAVLLAQARLAARNGISLDTVLRRYLAGYTLLSDFLLQEAEKSDSLKGTDLQRLLRAQAALFDRLLAAVSEEYAREEQSQLGSTDQHRADRIRRLLDGDLIDTSDFAYGFDAHHLGVIATGPEAETAIRDLAGTFESRLLLVRREEGSAWGWFGSRDRLDPAALEACARPAQVTIASGEPAHGLSGWRLTHRQARAALPLALRGPNRFVRYSDVALLASMLRDDLLVTSLREIYLEPLEQERDGGEIARETLRAYFSADRNVSSAAAMLGVSRQAVGRRLRSIEERLGRPLNGCAGEMEAALRLEGSIDVLDLAGSSEVGRRIEAVASQ